VQSAAPQLPQGVDVMSPPLFAMATQAAALHGGLAAAATLRDSKLLNFRTDFSARESYEQQDAATGQKPNVGSVCVSIVQHSPTTRTVSTYFKEVARNIASATAYCYYLLLLFAATTCCYYLLLLLTATTYLLPRPSLTSTAITSLAQVLDEEDVKGFARKVVTYSKGVKKTEEKLALRTDVHFAYARNKGDARFHHTFNQDIISLYKTGKVRHAFAAWYDGKVLPGCKNYTSEEGEKWTDFPVLLPELEEARGFTDGVYASQGRTGAPRLPRLMEWPRLPARFVHHPTESPF
jgi:hypothetical protein